jgi:selenocysteine lyase/cysteine desulfurase
MTFDVGALREREFPWTLSGDAIFLNSASTGAMPLSAQEAAVSITRRRAFPAAIPDAEIFETLARSRALIARLVGAGADEIALAPNTSFGVNLAANALPLKSGDVVLTFAGEFPANVYPWMSLAQKGVEVRFVRCVNGLPDEALLLRSLDDERVRAVAVSWVQFSSGYTVDLATLGRECRARGIYLAVDGIQGLSPLTLDLSALQVDVFASGCQKWLLSPWGTGFVYVRRGLVGDLQPVDVGWLAFKGSEDFNNMVRYAPELREDARKFEVGTLGLQDFAAMNASVELLLSEGTVDVARHVAALTSRLSEWALLCDGVELRSPAEASKRAGIVSLGFADCNTVATALRSAGVAISVRENAVRLACHLFNTESEIDRVIANIEAVI